MIILGVRRAGRILGGRGGLAERARERKWQGGLFRQYITWQAGTSKRERRVFVGIGIWECVCVHSVWLGALGKNRAEHSRAKHFWSLELDGWEKIRIWLGACMYEWG